MMRIGSVYKVNKLTGPVKIDADWSKPQWKDIEPADVAFFMGEVPDFQPEVQVKMMYDNFNLYLIFNVIDRFVRCLTKDFNGPVWEDSCVEFFFAPENNFTQRYFNLEVNCSGTPLMHYNIIPRKEIRTIEVNELARVEIAHTLAGVIDREIKEPVTWSVELRIPLNIPGLYSKISYPAPGVEWRGNFYKTAKNNSNPHYIAWNPVINLKPDFHLPEYFGILRFQ
jgi:hypothetical protein